MLVFPFDKLTHISHFIRNTSWMHSIFSIFILFLIFMFVLSSVPCNLKMYSKSEDLDCLKGLSYVLLILHFIDHYSYFCVQEWKSLYKCLTVQATFIAPTSWYTGTVKIVIVIGRIRYLCFKLITSLLMYIMKYPD